MRGGWLGKKKKLAYHGRLIVDEGRSFTYCRYRYLTRRYIAYWQTGKSVEGAVVTGGGDDDDAYGCCTDELAMLSLFEAA